MEYKAGTMAIQAVAGAGKTFIITHLVARLLEDMNNNGDKGKILILTYMNSAVSNFKTRIRNILDSSSIPKNRFEVMTIHSLALSIIKDNSNLAFSDDYFFVIDDYMKSNLLSEAIEEYRAEFISKMKVDPIRRFIKDGFENTTTNQFSKKTVAEDWEIKFRNYCIEAIRLMKYEGMEDTYMLNEVNNRCRLYEKLYKEKNIEFINYKGIFNIIVPIYNKYQQRLRNMGYMDYDDILYLAYRILADNPDIAAKYQKKYRYVFEDECQDSNLLQGKIIDIISYQSYDELNKCNEEIIKSNADSNCIDEEIIKSNANSNCIDEEILKSNADSNCIDEEISKSNADSNCIDEKISENNVDDERMIHLFDARNLVRIGDVNQSITGSFTGSNPMNFSKFCDEADYYYNMDMSSRSSGDIIDIANFLVYIANIDKQNFINKSYEEIESMYSKSMCISNKTIEYGDGLIPVFTNEVTKNCGYKENPRMDFYAIDTVEIPDYAKNVKDYKAISDRNILDEIMKIKSNHPSYTIGILAFSNYKVGQISDFLKEANIEHEVLGEDNNDRKKIITDVKACVDFLLNPNDTSMFKRMFKTVFVDRFFENIGLKNKQDYVDDVNNYLKNIDVDRWLFDDEYYRAYMNGCDSKEVFSSKLNRTDEFKAIFSIGDIRDKIKRITMYSQSNLCFLVECILGEIPMSHEESLLSKHLLVYVDNLVKFEHISLDGLSQGLDFKLLRYFDSSIDSIYEYEEKELSAGSITVSTLHKSKGLEWDACLLVGLDRSIFPTRLEEEKRSCVSYLKPEYMYPGALIRQDMDYFKNDVELSFRSQMEKSDYYVSLVKKEIINERLRLLYVGITRAKKMLYFVCTSKNNSGFFYDIKNHIELKKAERNNR